MNTESGSDPNKGTHQGSTSADLRELHENWEATKSALKKQFDQLTDADLKLEPGGEKDTYERIGHRLNKRPEEAMRLVWDAAQCHITHTCNSSASTVGTHTLGTGKRHRDMPVAAERKARRDAPKPDEPSGKE